MHNPNLTLPAHTLLLITILISCRQQESRNADHGSHDHVSREPQIFAEGIICTGDYETHPAFSPSGDTVYFLKCMPDLSTCAICVSYKKKDAWSSPVVAPFSGKYLDVDPFVTSDGNTIYFVTNRPVNAGDTLNSSWDIWKVNRNGSGWDDPVRLDSPVNSAADEYYPTLADNGSLYFGSSRKGGKGGSDIYCSRLVNGTAVVENLGDSINGTDNEYEAFIAPDESYLIFMATIPKGLANADFYVSFRKNDRWTRATKIISPVNSTATEWSPKVTRDGKYFFFGSTRNGHTSLPKSSRTLQDLDSLMQKTGNGLGDIYYINFSSLPLR